MSASSKKRRKKNPIDKKNTKSSRTFLIIGVAAIIAIVILVGVLFSGHQNSATTTPTSAFILPTNKPIILYVNQGNGLVNQNNFSSFITFAKANHFNTVFFQIYRSGKMLFNQSQLSFFVNAAHIENLSIFFALYFTSPSQQIPSSIYGLGENGINLDMSTLSTLQQTNLLSTVTQNYKNGETAVTSTNFTTSLRPNYLILETYNFPSDQQFVRRGIIAAIEPLAIATSQSYEQQFQYALSNSDGVMVFDYYGLLKTAY